MIAIWGIRSILHVFFLFGSLTKAQNLKKTYPKPQKSPHSYRLMPGVTHIFISQFHVFSLNLHILKCSFFETLNNSQYIKHKIQNSKIKTKQQPPCQMFKCSFLFFKMSFKKQIIYPPPNSRSTAPAAAMLMEAPLT